MQQATPHETSHATFNNTEGKVAIQAGQVNYYGQSTIMSVYFPLGS